MINYFLEEEQKLCFEALAEKRLDWTVVVVNSASSSKMELECSLQVKASAAQS